MILPCYRFVIKLLKSMIHAKGIRLIFFMIHFEPGYSCIMTTSFHSSVFYHVTSHANIVPSTDCHSPGSQSLVRRDVECILTCEICFAVPKCIEGQPNNKITDFRLTTPKIISRLQKIAGCIGNCYCQGRRYNSFAPGLQLP